MKLGGSLERRRRRRRKDNGGDGSSRASSATSGRLAAWVVGLAFAGWFLGYVVATRVVFPAPPPPGDLHAVPDLSGADVSGARERLAGANLELGGVDSIAHPSVAPDRVIGQSPLPGQSAVPGTPVRITVSLGPQSRSVPDVLGLGADQALVVLQASGFAVRTDSAESEEPRGRVIGIVPDVNRTVALPAEVEVLISTGPPTIPMPLVLGMEEGEATALLDSLGLVVVEVRELFRFGRDQGIVVEQEPTADAELERGAEVRLAVGRRGG